MNVRLWHRFDDVVMTSVVGFCSVGGGSKEMEVMNVLVLKWLCRIGLNCNDGD